SGSGSLKSAGVSCEAGTKKVEPASNPIEAQDFPTRCLLFTRGPMAATFLPKSSLGTTSCEAGTKKVEPASNPIEAQDFPTRCLLFIRGPMAATSLPKSSLETTSVTAGFSTEGISPANPSWTCSSVPSFLVIKGVGFR
ncbi:hypothetical protein Tco_0619651, partial [Tanacetum coccineum]